MCCALLALVLAGPRFFGIFWWIFQPGRWQLAFNDFLGGTLWWIWPILGIIFLPVLGVLAYIVARPVDPMIGSGA